MSHAIENVNGRWSFAFTGERSEIWHSLGQQVERGSPIEVWAQAAGMVHTVKKVDALARFPNGDTVNTYLKFLARTDTNAILGHATDGYQIVQPFEVLEWFDHYIMHDNRFQLSAAGVLDFGKRLWATAEFDGDYTIAGDKHRRYLLMNTTYDSTGATVNQATVTRTVCANTMRVAMSDKRAQIKTRHSTTFNGRSVALELAAIAQSFDDYKVMGEALAKAVMTIDQVQSFFAKLTGAATDDKVSTRKKNIIGELDHALMTTQRERNSFDCNGWTALQAVTRYVDHDRTVRNAGDGKDNEIAGRFESANWGSGDSLKSKAFDMLKELCNV
jgi:phage/plasmid-like protein (TIGR03299 family)